MSGKDRASDAAGRGRLAKLAGLEPSAVADLPARGSERLYWSLRNRAKKTTRAGRARQKRAARWRF